MNQVEDKVILTRSELQEMLNEAATFGKFKPAVESPLFNTNILFDTEYKKFKQMLNEIQSEYGVVRHERWGTVPVLNANQIHNQIRRIVLISFLAEFNTEIPISKRVAAKDLYTKLSNMFLEEFQQTCESRISKVEH